MKPIGVIIFVAGAATGGLSAYFILKKKFDADLKEEIEDVKRVYSNEKKEELNFTTKDTTTYSVGTFNSSIAEEAKPVEEAVNEVIENYIPKEKAELADEIEENRRLGMLNPSEDPDFPYLISEDTYVETKENYSKDILHYYAGDHVVADDELEAIIHPEMMVGDRLEEYFDYMFDVDRFTDSIYIRNDQISRDFEIVYHDDSFFC